MAVAVHPSVGGLDLLVDRRGVGSGDPARELEGGHLAAPRALSSNGHISGSPAPRAPRPEPERRLELTPPAPGSSKGRLHHAHDPIHPVCPRRSRRSDGRRRAGPRGRLRCVIQRNAPIHREITDFITCGSVTLDYVLDAKRTITESYDSDGDLVRWELHARYFATLTDPVSGLVIHDDGARRVTDDYVAETTTGVGGVHHLTWPGAGDPVRRRRPRGPRLERHAAGGERGRRRPASSRPDSARTQSASARSSIERRSPRTVELGNRPGSAVASTYRGAAARPHR